MDTILCCQSKLSVQHENKILTQRGMDMIKARMDVEIHVCSENEFRLSTQTLEEAEKIIEILSEGSQITWRILKTDPNNRAAGQKNLFYKEFRCQSSDTRIASTTERPHGKHTDCEAEMMVVVKRIGPRTAKRTKDRHLPAYPTRIFFRNEHNHYVNCANNVKYKDVSNDTRNKFLKLFEDGYSPYSALDVYKMDLRKEYGSDYYLQVADRSICPDLQWCYRLYSKIRTDEYGNFSKEGDVDRKLGNLISRFPDSVRQAKVDGQLVIAICTPLMKRIHESLPSCSEMMFIDSSGNFDREQYRVFMPLTHSYAGALPTGIIVSASEKAEVLSRGLELLLEIVGKDVAFYGTGAPDIIMTDDSTSERNGLKSVFPFAMLLLCIFHVLQAIWRYIYKSDNWNNLISSKHKPEVFSYFKKMVYASTKEELLQIFKSMNEKEIFKKNTTILKYAFDLFETRESWALCFRKDAIIRGHNTNNFSEATMRILKDKIFGRKCAYNVVQLVDFILTRIDDYYERKLIDITSGKDLRILVQNSFLNVDQKKLTDLVVVQSSTSNTIFTVENTKKGTIYDVDISLEVCTCHIGINGAPCKHQCAVIMYENRENLRSPVHFYTETENQRKLLHYIATGSKEIQSNWYKSLKIQADHRQPLSNNSSDNIDISHRELEETTSPQLDQKDDERNPNFIDKERKENVLRMNSKFQEFFFQEIETQAGLNMFESFYKNFFSLKANSARESALYNFGKSQKRYRKFINVQTTSIMRRKMKIGGVRLAPKGRPVSKENMKLEHNYNSINRLRKKAPHSLQFCVDNNVASGR